MNSFAGSSFWSISVFVIVSWSAFSLFFARLVFWFSCALFGFNSSIFEIDELVVEIGLLNVAVVIAGKFSFGISVGLVDSSLLVFITIFSCSMLFDAFPVVSFKVEVSASLQNLARCPSCLHRKQVSLSDEKYIQYLVSSKLISKRWGILSRSSGLTYICLRWLICENPVRFMPALIVVIRETGKMFSFFNSSSMTTLDMQFSLPLISQ